MYDPTSIWICYNAARVCGIIQCFLCGKLPTDWNKVSADWNKVSGVSELPWVAMGTEFL